MLSCLGLLGAAGCHRPLAALIISPPTVAAVPVAPNPVAPAPAVPLGPVLAHYEWVAPMLTNYTLNMGIMAADAAGNTYVGGWQQGKGTLASAEGQQLLLGVGRYNIDLGFVASYGPQGQLRWAQGIRNLYLRPVYVQDVVTGTGGQVYALGNMGVAKTVFSSSDGRPLRHRS